MLTIAFIGNGKSTNRYHLPFVLTRPESFRVKTIYGRSKPVWPTLPDVEYVSDIEQVWSDPEVDLVVVTTAFESHASFARTALERGKNVLVEKPFTETAEEARELFALADERGLFLQTYQNRRFDSDLLTVQKVIESGVLGELLEVEMHYDYYRPETPMNAHPTEGVTTSYLFGHAVHTVDQVLSVFGSPDRIHYDVRQLLGPGRMNDYFDIDLYYGVLKVSVKSSFFRLVGRPGFAVYGKKGVFMKHTKDRQEEHLKVFYMPGNPGFGIDLPEHYGTVSYIDDEGGFHEEKVVSEIGDYARFYDGVYASIVNGAPKVVTDVQTIELMGILEEGIKSWVPATDANARGQEAGE
ncbi:Gfo/Idh/MocA family oxidoreductase [Cryobacterium arcticum]|uniref:NAD(P)-dependent oxidoreductase n=1 Tax=Cryobacterium arcticum TaxID=670052 RepID=A0A317ZKU5_9MICO|nr:Gfo/Idh/MocA family oxidoreductase [Cryobacterium arcticum]PXA67141.1 NAD(P)-dependent oxidoreductase [Cryobacterium arcticum]